LVEVLTFLKTCGKLFIIVASSERETFGAGFEDTKFVFLAKFSRYSCGPNAL
jgi:hypothetical protein